jgi:Ca2+:H+ antiporter
MSLHSSERHNGHHGESANERHPLLSGFRSHPDGESGRRGFNPAHFLHIAWKSSNKVSMLVNILWPFVPLAIVLQFTARSHPLLIFTISYIGMVPAANLLGFAGQEFARKMPKVSGILIETAFGSVVEIVLFLILIVKHKSGSGSAEHGNLIPVIQAAILGSILTNLLLCLGLCFFVGGIRKNVQTFHAAVSEVGSGVLLVAGLGLLIPSAFYSALKGAAVDPLDHKRFTLAKLQLDVLKISQTTSILLMISFFMLVLSCFCSVDY